MRRLRYIPEGGALVEVTCRTIHSRFLLRPGLEVNDIVVGVLGRTQQKYPTRCCGYFFASNHFHLILDVDDARQLSEFFPFLRRLQEKGWWVGLRGTVAEEAGRRGRSPRPLSRRLPARR